MTMYSFRSDDDEAAAVERWVEALGVGRSEFVREALHRHMVRLQSEIDIQTWTDAPATSDEGVLSEIADWGPAEDWSEWVDAQG